MLATGQLQRHTPLPHQAQQVSILLPLHGNVIISNLGSPSVVSPKKTWVTTVQTGNPTVLSNAG